MMNFRRGMRTLVAGALVAGALVAAGCGSGAGSSASGALVDIGAGVRGPAGLHATVYATGLPRVAAFAFDGQSRLWVATAGYTDDGIDAVYVVAKPGTTAVKVIGGVHTPLGLLWYHGALYVASKARVDAYTGLRGNRFATRRTVVTLPAGVGEVNDIVLAPDGRMLVGVSASCDHCTPASEYSGAIVSFRPDGGSPTIYASGIRAPVGLAFFPNTTDLFVTMNYRDDLGARTTGDALAVVSAGSSWGNPGCYGQGGAACSGVPSVTAVLDKHAAVSDVAIVNGRLGPAVGTAAIVAEWSPGKVQRVGLEKTGAIYHGTVTTLLTGIKNPVAVTVTPDRAILVGDWASGTVYRIATT